MAIKPIVTFPVAGLKSKALPVTEFNDQLRQLVVDMIDTMHEAPGVGLAAPQIGVPLQVAVIAGQVAQSVEDDAEEPEDSPEDSPDTPEDGAAAEARAPSLVLINPEIIAAEGEQVGEEGCLSVREYSTNVPRFDKIRVTARDLAGNRLDFEAEGFFARVIQHELDHLKGTLFIDRISPLKRALYRKKLKKILQAEQA